MILKWKMEMMKKGKSAETDIVGVSVSYLVGFICNKYYVVVVQGELL